MKNHSRKNNSRGFTLIETAVVLAIVSVMVASFLGAYRVQIVKEKRDVTLERLDHIRQSMIKFQSKTGNSNRLLPCPAPRHVAPGASTFGIEDVAATYTCSTTPAGSLNDTTRVSGVRIGMVPTTTLGLPTEDGFDSWGRRFLYVVSEDHATGSGTPYSATTGAITLLDASNASLGPAPFVIVSMGRNGAGGVTYGGPDFVVPCSDAGTQEQENCDGDATFHEGLHSESGGTANFDDYITHDLDNIGGGGGGGPVAEYIDELKDGISDYNANNSTSVSTVFLGQNAGAANIPVPYANPPYNNTSYGFCPTNASTLAQILYCTWPGHFNTGTGINALAANTYGQRNTADGYWAMYSNTQGIDNTATGAYALGVNNGVPTVVGVTGSYNTADGAWALIGNTNAALNTATGARTLAALSIGTGNTANGMEALHSNTTGVGNTAVGAYGEVRDSNITPVTPYAALQSNTTGSYNTALGVSALGSNTAGSYNTAAGAGALRVSTTANLDTAIGHGAMYNNTDNLYGRNTAVGAKAMYNSVTKYSDNGGYNVATGYSALYSSANSASGINTATGAETLYNNVGSDGNTATGWRALHDNTLGVSNIVDGAEAMHDNVEKWYNVAVGYRAMYCADNSAGASQPYNTAVGAHALEGPIDCAPHSTGTSNTAVGHSALLSDSTGSLNTAVGGYQAMPWDDGGSNFPGAALGSNTTGNLNTAVGAGAGNGNDIGTGNTALGTQALLFNKAKNFNTAVGYHAMFFADNSTGSADGNNTAVGSTALSTIGVPSSNTGTNNTALGERALESNASGNNNTAVGHGAGNYGVYANTSGSGNTFIGTDTLDAGGWGNFSNITAIGYGAMVPASNAVQIGYSLGSSSLITDVYFGSTGTNVYAGNSLITPSDSRLKKDIRDSDLGLDFVEKLRPVSYRFKEGSDALRYGFIAQEVEKTLGERITGIVSRQADKMKTYALNYSDLIAPIVRAIQEIMALLHGHEKMLQEQQAMVEKYQGQIQSISESVKNARREIETLEAASGAK